MIKAKHLTVSYGKNVIINDADFEVKKGDFVCVVGANGSGKSTLIKTILGLVKPDEGEIEYSKSVKKNMFGYLPQDPKYDQIFPATVSEVVLSGTLGKLKFRPFYTRRCKRSLSETLDLLKISDLRYERFSELSGGQKQKVLLARAIIATSSLIILDEPSNNLDQKSRKEFYKTLKKLNKDKKLTIIMITHDLDSDDLIGNKVIAIKNGKTVCKTTKQFLRSYK